MTNLLAGAAALIGDGCAASPACAEAAMKIDPADTASGSDPGVGGLLEGNRIGSSFRRSAFASPSSGASSARRFR
jgi:hypothetical protein